MKTPPNKDDEADDEERDDIYLRACAVDALLIPAQSCRWTAETL
jgi:hypothetical protein